MKRMFLPLIVLTTTLLQTGWAYGLCHIAGDGCRGTSPAVSLGGPLLRPGDLLFFRETKGMGAAVKESTGQYTHVAIVEGVGDTVWVIDATPSHGVARRPFLCPYGDGKLAPDIFRPDVAHSNPDSVLIRARSYIGLPYDNAFLPGNGALYCSELIYECFLEDYDFGAEDDRHLFKAAPMNWRNANGDLPRYWKRHFKKLKMPVPEGVMGTNPTDLSRSPLLMKLCAISCFSNS